jgi:hypothetical protein
MQLILYINLIPDDIIKISNSYFRFLHSNGTYKYNFIAFQSLCLLLSFLYLLIRTNSIVLTKIDYNDCTYFAPNIKGNILEFHH